MEPTTSIARPPPRALSDAARDAAQRLVRRRPPPPDVPAEEIAELFERALGAAFAPPAGVAPPAQAPGPRRSARAGVLLPGLAELDDAVTQLLAPERGGAVLAAGRLSVRQLVRSCERTYLEGLPAAPEQGPAAEPPARRLLDALPLAVTVLDGECRLRYANRGAVELLELGRRAAQADAVEAWASAGARLLGRAEQFASFVRRCPQDVGPRQRAFAAPPEGVLLLRSAPLGSPLEPRTVCTLTVVVLRPHAAPASVDPDREHGLGTALAALQRRARDVSAAVGSLDLALERERRTVGPRLPAGPRATHGLTPREREVLRGLAEGRTNEQIGRALGLAPETIRTYGQRATEKLGALTRTHAVAIALRTGLIAG